MLKTLQKVQKYIYNHHLIKSEGQIIVGVSGGADSVMLLHLLLSIGYDCVIAHCNFHLRADESERDEIFVQSLAQKLKIPYYHIDFNTKEIAKEKHISIEMAARDLRYNWFKDLLIELNGQAIAVAHHADDNIETLLMNLVRGTGLRGLTGMSPRNGNVIRPLLCCNRLEIEKYLLENQLEYVTDSSNLSNDYKRNKFRNVILPLLEEINPSVRQTLCESIERFEGTLAIYEQAISNFNDELIEINSNNVRINICLLNKQINKKIILYELLKPYGFSSAVVEQIVSHLDSESGKLFYSVTHRLVKDRDFLIISIIESKKNELYWIDSFINELTEPFRILISKQQVDRNFKISKNSKLVHIDSTKLHYPLLLRHWQDGDAFYPCGMNKLKKISDYFIDNKFSMLDKENCWLLVSGNDIVWVVGHRIDNRYKVTENTTQIIELALHLE